MEKKYIDVFLSGIKNLCFKIAGKRRRYDQSTKCYICREAAFKTEKVFWRNL